MRSSKVFAATLLAASVTPMAAHAAEDGLDALDGLEMDVLDVGVSPDEAATRILVLPQAVEAAPDGGAELGESTTEAVGEALVAEEAETAPRRERRRPAAERPDEHRNDGPRERPEPAREDRRPDDQRKDDNRRHDGPRPGRAD